MLKWLYLFLTYDAFPALLNMSIVSSLIILIVLAARFLLRKAPKVFSYCLWGVVLFRLLCPVTFSSPLSLFNLTEAGENALYAAGSREAAAERPSGRSLGEWHREETEAPVPAAEYEKKKPAVGNDPALKGSEEAETIFRTPAQGQEDLLGSGRSFPLVILWLGGAAVLLIGNGISYLRVRGRIAEAVRLRDNIYLCDAITMPFCMGVLYPGIYLPSSLSENEQRFVILHERHHIKRGDHIIKIAAFFALCLHWFNPLVWLAFILAGKDMEMSCDEAVMRMTKGDGRAEYSEVLLRLAAGRRIVSASPLAFGEGNPKQRIVNIMNYKKPGFWAVIAAGVLCAVLALGLGTNPKREKTDDAVGQQQNEVRVEPETDETQVLGDAQKALVKEAASMLGHPEKYRKLGFSLQDVDGDGTQEILFGESDDSDGAYNGAIYDMYGIKDGKPVHLLEGSADESYHLTKDGRIARFWPDSEEEYGCEIYQLDGTALIMQHKVVLNRETGSVLTLVSHPEYTEPVPGEVVKIISSGDMEMLMEQLSVVSLRFTPVSSVVSEELVETPKQEDETEYFLSYIVEGLAEDVPAELVEGDGFTILIPKGAFKMYAPDAWCAEANEQVQIWVAKRSDADAGKATADLIREGFRQNPSSGKFLEVAKGIVREAEIKATPSECFVVYYTYPEEGEEGWRGRLQKIADSFCVGYMEDAYEQTEKEAAGRQVAVAFAEALFERNREQMQKYLKAGVEAEFLDDLDTSRTELGQVQGTWGLGAVADGKYRYGEISVEFKLSPDADYYMYLSIGLDYSEKEWKVAWYGLEG